MHSIKKTLDNNHLNVLLQKLEPANNWDTQYTTGTTLIEENNINEITSSLAHQYETNFVRKTSFLISIETATIFISEANLKKVLDELIENAFKFSDDHSCVEIIGKRFEDTYKLTIKNQGREFYPEHIQQIGPYMQFEREKYEQQGLGLGLWIAQKLVTLNKGQLTVESLDGDTTIIILFKM